MTRDHPLLTVDAAGRETIIDTLRRSLAAEDGLAYAYLFGSFVDGGPFHDVDLALYFSALAADQADQRAFEIQGRLEDILRVDNLGRVPIDVVALNGRPVSFRFHVFRGLALLVRDDEALTSDLEWTAREYFDQERRLRLATVEAFAK